MERVIMLKTAQEVVFPNIFSKVIDNIHTWLLIQGGQKKKRDHAAQEI